MKNKFTSKILLFALIGLSGIVNAQIPTDNLVAWYPFNGNANDLSGNNLNGTSYGATLTTDRFGNNNNAYYLNGASFIGVPHNPILNPFPISLCAWIKITADGPFVSKYFNGSSNGLENPHIITPPIRFKVTP
jgi:hypothetical protein